MRSARDCALVEPMPVDAGSREQSVLVGRDYELNQLRAALDGALQRRT